MKGDFDVAIVGAGIVGLGTAMALTKRGRTRIVVLEAENDPATHQTGHNSGVIHSGLYYRPGSLKAEFCRRGREAMYDFCVDERIPHEMCGKLVVASRSEELPRLHELQRRGVANGLRQLRLLDAHELREYEPAVSGVQGLWVGETGIVDFRAVASRMARVTEAAGGEIRLNSRVLAVHRNEGLVTLETRSGAVTARLLINCAGLQADRVATMAGAKVDLRIVPFRGEYYTLRPERTNLVRNLIYPVPNPDLPFLGVHFSRTIRGSVEAGPNAVLALKREGYSWRNLSIRDVGNALTFPGFWRMAASHWRTGLAEVRRSLSKKTFVASLQELVPDIVASDLETGGSGVRAQAVNSKGELLNDFCIIRDRNAIHLLNAPSPAATSSITIGETLASDAEAQLIG